MRKLALAALLVSTAALAQTTPAPLVGPDNGFFRPTPLNDPSLTRDPLVAARQAAAEQLAAQQAAEMAANAPVIQAPMLLPEPVINAEVETARAAREAEAERLRAATAPQPITGAFTGLTSERDR